MSTIPRPDVSEVSATLRDLGTSTKQVALEAKDAAKDVAAVTAEKAVDAASGSAAKVRELAEGQAASARRRQRKAAAKSHHHAVRAQRDATKAAKRAKAKVRSTSADVASTAARLLEDAGTFAGNAVPTGKSKPKKSHRVVKTAGLLAVVGAGIAAARTLRPKQTAVTGSSIPPKVRPVPVPSDKPAATSTPPSEPVEAPPVEAPPVEAPPVDPQVTADSETEQPA